MIDPIVHSDRPVTLVGAGQATAQDLQISLTMAQTCVAADGGAAQALAAGVTPAAVIGDLDSLDADTRDRFISLLSEEVKKTGAALLFVSHDGSLAKLFDRALDLTEINQAVQIASAA